MAVSRPLVHGHLEDHLLDVEEARLLVPALQAAGDAQRAVSLHRGRVERGHPLLEGPVVRHGAIVAVRRRHDLLTLHVPPGLEVVEGPADDVLEVREGAEQNPRVDVVEVARRHHPVGLAGIVDEEVNVPRNRRGLDGGEIGSLDLSVGELVAHLDSPLASPGADIQDGPGVFEWCKVILV